MQQTQATASNVQAALTARVQVCHNQVATVTQASIVQLAQSPLDQPPTCARQVPSALLGVERLQAALAQPTKICGPKAFASLALPATGATLPRLPCVVLTTTVPMGS